MAAHSRRPYPPSLCYGKVLQAHSTSRPPIAERCHKVTIVDVTDKSGPCPHKKLRVVFYRPTKKKLVVECVPTPWPAKQRNPQPVFRFRFRPVEEAPETSPTTLGTKAPRKGASSASMFLATFLYFPRLLAFFFFFFTRVKIFCIETAR